MTPQPFDSTSKPNVIFTSILVLRGLLNLHSVSPLVISKSQNQFPEERERERELFKILLTLYIWHPPGDSLYLGVWRCRSGVGWINCRRGLEGGKGIRVLVYCAREGWWWWFPEGRKHSLVAMVTPQQGAWRSINPTTARGTDTRQ